MVCDTEYQTLEEYTAEVSVVITRLTFNIYSCTKLFVFLLLILLLIIDYRVALTTGMVMFSTYLIIFQIMKNHSKNYLKSVLLQTK